MTESQTISEYLITQGWKKEWFNDLGTIARLSCGIFGRIFSAKIASHWYEPFYKKDRNSGRKLYLRDIFPVGSTKISFSSKLNGNSFFEDCVVGISGEEIKFDFFYEFGVPTKFDTVFPDPYLIIDPDSNSVFSCSVITLTFIREVSIRFEY